MAKKEYFNLKFPTKKRWLSDWWKRSINTFLYAIENEEVQENIKQYRKMWLTDETGNTPEQLRLILKRIFLKDSESGKDLSQLTWHGVPVSREGDDYYFTAVRSADGYTKVPLGSVQQPDTRWLMSNPFYIFDDHEIMLPETKMRLINELAEPNENYSLFQPRFSIREEVSVYPSSHITISTLHNLGFLRPLDMHILGRFNLDYFTFWPMFFYYALTNDVDYVIKNASFLTYPIKVFLVEDGEHDNLVLRFYGDCNFNMVQEFIKENKPRFEKLSKLLGNPTITGSGLKDYHMYKAKQEAEMDSLKAFSELGKNKVIKQEVKEVDQMSYKDHMAKASVHREGDLIGNRKLAKKMNEKTIKRINVAYSQVKKEVQAFSKYDKYKAFSEAKKLIDEINQPIL